MKNQRIVLGFFREDGKTKPVTKSRAQLNRKKLVKNPRKMNAVKPNGSRWNLSYKRNRQLKEITKHFLEQDKPTCFFCHKPITERDLPDNITDHHINGNREDNRSKNKALAHETCHRKHNYNEVKPRNPGNGDFVYYHGTTVSRAQEIKKTGRFTQGTLVKSKRFATTHAKRFIGSASHVWSSRILRPCLVKLTVDRNLGRAVDVGRKVYPQGTDALNVRNVQIIPLKHPP